MPPLGQPVHTPPLGQTAHGMPPPPGQPGYGMPPPGYPGYGAPPGHGAPYGVPPAGAVYPTVGQPYPGGQPYSGGAPGYPHPAGFKQVCYMRSLF